jgi:hypothetical protein
MWWHPQAKPAWYGKNWCLEKQLFISWWKDFVTPSLKRIPLYTIYQPLKWPEQNVLENMVMRDRILFTMHLICHLLEPRSSNTEYDIVFNSPKCKQIMYILEINGVTKKEFWMFWTCGCMNM